MITLSTSLALQKELQTFQKKMASLTIAERRRE
jgi:hypothetical protein